jgi:hypothetical protein
VRKEAQGFPDRFDLLLHGSPLVVREALHDDDVTGAQLGHDHLGDVGFEPVVVDRSVERPWRGHAGHTQGWRLACDARAASPCADARLSGSGHRCGSC